MLLIAFSSNHLLTEPLIDSALTRKDDESIGFSQRFCLAASTSPVPSKQHLCDELSEFNITCN